MRTGLRACVLVVCFLLSVSAFAVAAESARAAGPNAVVTPVGYDAQVVPRGDDTSALIVNLPFTMRWNGTNYTQIYINMNGNCSFGSDFRGYNPNNSTLAATSENIMAPLWSDVDTRNNAASQVTYSSTTPGSVPTVNGRPAFLVNWIDVASYNMQAAPTNSFQLVIIDRSDTGAGNFDFVYNYDVVAWDIATAASSRRARAGWGRAGTGFELPGSGVFDHDPSALTDAANPATSLIQNSMNDEGQLGRYVWQVRGGAAPNMPPRVVVVNRTLEANSPVGYAGYAGVGDATATDSDGTISSLTDNRPVDLPLGTTSVTWTATDNLGAVTNVVQSILVRDTVAPSNPALTSPTHVVGSWTKLNLATVNSAGATDSGSGVRGFSYLWTLNPAAVPDTVVDPSVTTTTTSTTTTVETQNFDSATWPSVWVRERVADAGDPETYLRMSNVRAASGYAAELWSDNNNTRRTAGFTKAFDLTSYTSATLSFTDYTAVLDSGSDYSRVERSIDGGTSWTLIQNGTPNSGWNPHSHALPVGGVVLLRFSGSVNRTNEYCDWDDISVSGVKTTTTTAMTTSSTSTLADGSWYYVLRTVDWAGNWSAPTNLGPLRIDTAKPTTTDNASAAWNTTPPVVVLAATDPSGPVATTYYKLNSAAVATYSAPFPVSAEGTTALQYWSVDVAGNIETAKTVSVRVDTVAPTVPSTLSASAVSTSAVDLTWSGSTDAVSGIAYYGIYRDGSLVASSTSTSFTAAGLTPGQTYAFSIAARDIAGNWSARTASVDETLPASQIWLTLSPTSVDFGSLDPGTSSVISSGTAVTVGGVGIQTYDLTCSAQDFSNLTTPTTTPTMPASVLKYAIRGWKVSPVTSFTNAAALADTSSGSVYVWRHAYQFDYTLNVPWTYEPGTYTTDVRYTVVAR